jgi:hypothetical protein
MKLLIASFVAVLFPASFAFGQNDIRKVDFKNFTYPPLCASDEPEKITVKDGEFSSEKQEEGYVDRFYFRVFEVSYGDLTGDGREEAIVLTVCNTGGTGNFSEGFVFGIKERKPVLIARIPGGDRAHGGLRTTRVEGGLLVVESNDAGEDGGACCPLVIVTTRYKLAGERIVRSGKETRRDIYPEVRVAFARGASGKTFRTKIPHGEGRRFVVGARAGQTLSVSVDTDKASLRLVGDIEVTQGTNNFMVRLPNSGDQIIEIRNESDADLTVEVNIKIQ